MHALTGRRSHSLTSPEPTADEQPLQRPCRKPNTRVFMFMSYSAYTLQPLSLTAGEAKELSIIPNVAWFVATLDLTVCLPFIGLDSIKHFFLNTTLDRKP